MGKGLNAKKLSVVPCCVHVFGLVVDVVLWTKQQWHAPEAPEAQGAYAGQEEPASRQRSENRR